MSGNDGSVVGKLAALSVGIYAGGWQIDCVGREQKWPQDRSLGDPRWNVQVDLLLSTCTHRHLVGEIRGKALEAFAIESDVGQFSKQSLVPHPVKRLR